MRPSLSLDISGRDRIWKEVTTHATPPCFRFSIHFIRSPTGYLTDRPIRICGISPDAVMPHNFRGLIARALAACWVVKSRAGLGEVLFCIACRFACHCNVSVLLRNFNRRTPVHDPIHQKRATPSQQGTEPNRPRHSPGISQSPDMTFGTVQQACHISHI